MLYMTVTVHAKPIRVAVNQPSAVTTPTALSDQQIDFLIHQYGPGATSGRYIHTPQDYVSTDSVYIRSTNPRTATTNRAKISNQQDSTPDFYVPTIRPYPKQTQGYDFYFPQADDFKPTDTTDPNLSYLRELQPPQRSEEPDYYAVLKMKKAGTKKYNANHKQVNLNGVASPRATVTPLSSATNSNEDQFDPAAYQPQPQSYDADIPFSGQATYRQETRVAQLPAERITPKSSIRSLRQEELNTGEYLPSILRNGNADNQRVEFQMHGFSGPNSYRFGFDTGKG